MSKIIGMMLVKNEADRYLRRVLESMGKVCDKIVVLDDHSADNTPEICREYGCEVFYSTKSYWGTDELKQRKHLWYLAQSYAEDGDWLLNLDADEVIAGVEKLRELIVVADAENKDAVTVNLFDMWSETHYRDDNFWTAHNREWVMCIKYEKNKEYEWNEIPLHCGRFPLNVGYNQLASGLKLQHWGWATPQDRQKKYSRYMEIDHDGKYGMLEQYESIIDENPTIKQFCL